MRACVRACRGYDTCYDVIMPESTFLLLNWKLEAGDLKLCSQVASEDIEKTAACSVLCSAEIKDGFKLRRGFLGKKAQETEI